MFDSDALYAAIGRKIRSARARSSNRVSQARLAEKVEVSRTSIVNIEAGRQHAPIHLLWRIAEELDIEPLSLIPRRSEFASSVPVADLPPKMRQQIAQQAKGSATFERDVTLMVRRMITTLDS